MESQPAELPQEAWPQVSTPERLISQSFPRTDRRLLSPAQLELRPAEWQQAEWQQAEWAQAEWAQAFLPAVLRLAASRRVAPQPVRYRIKVPSVRSLPEAAGRVP